MHDYTNQRSLSFHQKNHIQSVCSFIVLILIWLWNKQWQRNKKRERWSHSLDSKEHEEDIRSNTQPELHFAAPVSLEKLHPQMELRLACCALWKGSSYLRGYVNTSIQHNLVLPCWSNNGIWISVTSKYPMISLSN